MLPAVALACGPGPFVINDTGEPTGALTDCGTRTTRCTLRNAVHAANQCAGRDARTIRFTAGQTARLQREPVINEGYPRVDGRSALYVRANVQLEITGGGTITRAGTARFRLFHVAPGASLTLVGMTLSNGSPPLATGGDGEGGAILNRGTLTIRGPRAFLSANAATSSGGAIANYGTLVIADAELSQNRIGLGGGGAILNAAGATATISATKFRKNEGQSFGGAIGNYGRITIERATFEENRANVGGALAMRDAGTGSISRSLFRANSASSAAAIAFLPNSDDLTAVSATTFSGNTATNIGGAIEASSGRLKLHDVTITLNSAPTGSGLAIGSSARVEAVNSIIAGNTGGASCAVTATLAVANPNLNDDGSCTGMSVRGAPRLQALRNAGGPTAVHLPASGSPAIESGGGCLTTDQRGYRRPATPTAAAGRCEIGAAEVTSLNDLGCNIPLPKDPLGPNKGPLTPATGVPLKR